MMRACGGIRLLQAGFAVDARVAQAVESKACRLLSELGRRVPRLSHVQGL